MFCLTAKKMRGMADFRREICDFCKFSGAVGVSRATNLYLARRLLVVVKKSEKLKKFGVGNSGLEFETCESLVVMLMYRVGRIYTWLDVCYWWVKKSEKLKNFGVENSGLEFETCESLVVLLMYRVGRIYTWLGFCFGG